MENYQKAIIVDLTQKSDTKIAIAKVIKKLFEIVYIHQTKNNDKRWKLKR